MLVSFEITMVKSLRMINSVFEKHKAQEGVIIRSVFEKNKAHESSYATIASEPTRSL
jgi:hypothetical protein